MQQKSLRIKSVNTNKRMSRLLRHPLIFLALLQIKKQNKRQRHMILEKQRRPPAPVSAFMDKRLLIYPLKAHIQTAVF